MPFSRAALPWLAPCRKAWPESRKLQVLFEEALKLCPSRVPQRKLRKTWGMQTFEALPLQQLQPAEAPQGPHENQYFSYSNVLQKTTQESFVNCCGCGPQAPWRPARVGAPGPRSLSCRAWGFKWAAGLAKLHEGSYEGRSPLDGAWCMLFLKVPDLVFKAQSYCI